jgi:esterase/lipase superfamily enzyme
MPSLFRAHALQARSASARRRSRILFASLLVAALLAGCQTPIRLMPTPVSFRTGEVDPFDKAGATAHATDVPVLYATNRGAVIQDPVPLYTILPSERLRMGVAHVQIGDGTLDWETLHRLSTSDDPDQRPIVQLDRLDPMASLEPGATGATAADTRAFFALVDEALAASPNRELVIYVHGSNNTVGRAAAQTAQLRHFAGRRVVMLSFMWPSAGSILRYFTDVANAEASVDPFVRLIELIAANTNAAAIDVVAYSAGAQIASAGLVKLGEPSGGESRAQLRERLRLRNVYYAAPDIDTRQFTDDMKRYVDIVERITVAGNLNDSALRVAALVHRASRAGRPNPTELDERQTEFLIEASQRLGFDVVKVDPNDIPGLPLRSHAFWYEDPWVSSDLLALLLLNAGPAERGLTEERTPSGGRYWRFPPDFYQRVVRLFASGGARAPDPGRSSAGQSTGVQR